MFCNDETCFANKKYCQCSILTSPCKDEYGVCKFKKPVREMTNGKLYPYNGSVEEKYMYRKLLSKY